MTSTKARATTLDDDSLAMLLDEVSAMAATGRPLASGLAGLDDSSMGKLRRATEAIRESIQRGESAAESIAALSGNFKAPIRVAMEVMTVTGSTEPIQEAVRLIRNSNEHRHEIRLASINPMLNVIVAATILFFVMPYILVSLSNAELIKTAYSPSIIEISRTFTQNVFLAAIATLAVIGLFAGVLYWGIPRSLCDVDNFRDHATFCRWLAIQLRTPSPSRSQTDGGLELGRVIEASAEVVGPAFAESWSSVIGNIRGGSKSVTSLAMPTETPDPVCGCIVDLVSGTRDSESISFDLRRLSELYTQKSLHYQAWWTTLFPRWVSWTVMVTIMVILLRAILMPLWEIVGEVAP